MACGISVPKVRKAYGDCARRKKVWRSHTSCGFTAYATVKEIGIPHLFRWGRMSTDNKKHINKYGTRKI